ncbi:TonB-dependent receptor [termite gut metagenome]|uniref:TonB-dependent receptor n=1 Tax=termite gut metagenome TaxID=433724 RepID=A0A5J4SXD1_9ZZZZ
MIKKLLFLSFTLFVDSLMVFAQNNDSLHFALDEVTVTSTRAQVNRNDVPITISVINRNEIEESSESALLPILSEQIPGMFITERGIAGFGVSSGGTGGITIRGVGGSPTTGVLVLIDGHPQYMGIMGHHLPDAYGTSNIERVEVIRGPASVLYGSNAMGGAVNIITRRQNKEGWEANGRLMYGSYNTQKYMANTGFKKNNFDAFVSINHDKTGGHRDNSDFRITNVYAKAGYDLSEHFRVWSDINIASYRTQNPGTMTKPIFENTADITRGVVSATLENDYGKSNGALKLFYNFGDHNINDGYAEKDNPPDFRFRSTDQNFGGTLYQIFRPIKGNEITAGFDFKSYGGRAWNDYIDKSKPDEIQVDTTTYEVAGYAIIQQTLFDKLTLNGGLRLEQNRNYGNEWLPQIGFAYRPQKYTTFKVSVSKGFRSPTIRELYYRAVWAAANPELKPERMNNYEASISQSFFDKRLSIELTGYVTKGSNLIQVQEGKNTNTGKFNNKGFEFTGKWYVMRNLELRGNYSYLHTDEPIAYAPKQQAYVATNYRLKDWNVNFSYQYINNMYSVTTGTNPLKTSYVLLNAKVSYHPLKSLGVFLTGENLMDKNYEIMAGYPMPGITVMGGVNISLSSH